MARDYRKLKIHSLSHSFLLRLYRDVLPVLPEVEQKNLFSQLQRAATSIVLNIVEGAARRSNKVFLNHLQYAYGSAKEVEAILHLCFDLDYIDHSLFVAICISLEEVKASLYRFMRAVEKEIKIKKENYTLL